LTSPGLTPLLLYELLANTDPARYERAALPLGSTRPARAEAFDAPRCSSPAPALTFHGLKGEGATRGKPLPPQKRLV
jgi:hypothetical protein